MRAVIRWVRDRQNPRHSRRRAAAQVNVETLEGRQLLSTLYTPPGGGQASISSMGQGGGMVRKAPHFYEFFIGPQRPDLNVVAASAQLKPGQGLVFRGTMAGKIDKAPATPADDKFYAFGINRGSPAAAAPFFQRPGIVFDAVVAVSVSHDTGITAFVVDLATGTQTMLSPQSVRIQGRQVQVTVDPSALPIPAGGKPMSQWTFNLWPRTSLANPAPTPTQPHPSFVASFIPENGMAPIHVPRGRGF